MIPSWISFLVILGFILIFSNKELGIVLIIASIFFGLLAQVDIISVSINTLLDPKNIILAIAVALIPILGGLMEKSGNMIKAIKKLNVSERASLMATPALFGLLPVAGGALMSAPLVDQISPEMKNDKKIAINVWYRHILILIYPLSSTLIISSQIAKIGLYMMAFTLIPSFFLMFIVGYFTMIRKTKEKIVNHTRDIKGALYLLIPVLIAPLIDFLGRTFVPFIIPEAFLLVGLIISIGIGLWMAGFSLLKVKTISKEMKIWRFPLLIIGMFLFLNVFKSSRVAIEISALSFPLIIFIIFGFFLGFATGRTEVPMSILIPLFFVQFGFSVMPLFDFSLIYTATFLGYLITPIHPCVAYSINYFNTNYKETLKELLLPTIICLGIVFLVYFLSIPFNQI
ncbi:MAG: DUF401 family protein [Candidatus Lokiarchaeota archaeon]